MAIEAGAVTIPAQQEFVPVEDVNDRFAVLNDQTWNQGVLRALPVDNYLVVYNVDNDAQQVNVLRIFYGRRDLPSLLRSETE